VSASAQAQAQAQPISRTRNAARTDLVIFPIGM